MTGESLYAAILAEPDDDAVRLVYADWLDDNDDPDRAEFIRAQIELTRLLAEQGFGWRVEEVIDPRGGRLRRRCRQLEQKHHDDWRGTLPDWAVSGKFHRGFLAEVAMEPDEFRRRAGEMFARFPVQRLCLDRGQPRKVGRHPGVARLRALEVYGEYFQQQGLMLLLMAEQLSGLHVLTVNDVSIEGDQMDRLAEAPALSGLRHLGFSQCNSLELGSLFASPRLGQLRGLSLNNNSLPGAVHALCASPLLAHLRSLDLSMNTEVPSGLEVLGTTPEAAGVRSLSLSCMGIEDAPGAALARSPHLRQLRRLDLSENQLSTGTARALAESGILTGCRWLELGENRFNDEAARALAGSPHAASLTLLTLPNNQIGDAGVAALADSPHLGELRRLDLRWNPFGNAGALALARSEHLQRIERLDLAGASYSPAVLDELRDRFGEALVLG